MEKAFLQTLRSYYQKKDLSDKVRQKSKTKVSFQNLVVFFKREIEKIYICFLFYLYFMI